jgi:hypothetical protein
LASLSVAYGLEIPSLLNAFSGFLRDTLKGRPVSAFAWARGLRDANAIRRTQVRLAHAKQRLSAEPDSGGALRIFGSDSKLSTAHRKAA